MPAPSSNRRRATLLCALGFSSLLAGSGCSSKEPAPSASPPAEPAPRYGALMVEVGRRFEVMGKAVRAGRWELAEFELGEIEETFEDLQHAEPPRESKGVDLKKIADAFAKSQVPAVAAAIKAKDPAAFTGAFAQAATTCNGCHQASGHRFVEIPSEPGDAVPRLTPLVAGVPDAGARP